MWWASGAFQTGGCNGGRLKWVCARMRGMQSKLLPACSRYGAQGFCEELMLWIMLCADAMPDPLCIYASLRHAEALLHALATFAAPAAVCIAPVASCQICSPCAFAHVSDKTVSTHALACPAARKHGVCVACTCVQPRSLGRPCACERHVCSC